MGSNLSRTEALPGDHEKRVTVHRISSPDWKERDDGDYLHVEEDLRMGCLAHE
jgi:hypothetical protein